MAVSAKFSLRSLTDDPATWRGASLLSVSQLSASGLHLLFQRAQEMRDLVRTRGGDQRLQQCVLGTAFFEASTRTASSFQAAIIRLGGKSIHVDGQGNSSAGKKGESLADTIRCLECYTDATVLRHPVQGSVGDVIEITRKPVINAGDGIGEHPTQALLDVFTIYDELKLSEQALGPLTVVMVGDLKNGRTVHSLAKLLSTSNIWASRLTLRYCSPDGLEMPRYVQDFAMMQQNVVQERYDDLEQACQGANVLYVTRIQRERFDSDEEYNKVKVSLWDSVCLFSIL